MTTLESLCVQYKQLVIALAKKHQAPIFSQQLADGVNGEKLFVLTNEKFLREYSSIDLVNENTFGLNLVSVYSDFANPAPFHRGQQFLELLKEDPWRHSAHLWFRIKNLQTSTPMMIHNVVMCLDELPYPEHLHAELWLENSQHIDKKYPFAWMNLIIEPNFVLPEAIINSLSCLMQRLVSEALEKKMYLYKKLQPLFIDFCAHESCLSDLAGRVDLTDNEFVTKLWNCFQENKELYAKFVEQMANDSELLFLWNKCFIGVLPQHRLDSFFHLLIHDDLFKFKENIAVNDDFSDHLHVADYSFVNDTEQAANLELANCLNVFFQLREKKFLEQIKSKFSREHYLNIERLVELIFAEPNVQMSDREHIYAYHFASYTSTEILYMALMHFLCPVIFLHGAWSQCQLQLTAGDLKNFRVPFSVKEPGGIADQTLIEQLNSRVLRNIL